MDRGGIGKFNIRLIHIEEAEGRWASYSRQVKELIFIYLH